MENENDYLPWRTVYKHLNDIIDILEALEKYKCAMIWGLPKILYNLINHPDRKKYDLSNLLLAVSGGQSISTDLIIKLSKELNIKMFISSYSTTETSSVIMKSYYLGFFNPDLYKYCIGKQSAFTETKIAGPIKKVIRPHTCLTMLSILEYLKYENV